MIKQTITVNHKKLATGLFWQPLSVGTSAYNYAKQLARNGDKKYSLYIEYKSMVGLTNAGNGVRSGMPSAAAEVVEALSDFVSFLAVFKVEGYFYLVAVRNGIIIRDTLIETEQQARQIYAELSNIPDWGGLFAPASWGMPKSQEKYLSELIGYGVVGRLHNISVFKSVIPSILFLIIFVILGGYFLRDLREPIKEMFAKKNPKQLNPELVEEYKRQIELKNKELDKQFEVTKKEIKPIEYPYDKLPNVMERASLCYKAIGFVMQPIAGWNQTYTKCDENYVSATFIRDFGNLNDFYSLGGDLMPGAIVQQMSDNEVIVRAKLPNLPVYSSIDWRDSVGVSRDVASNFQKLNTKANINTVTDTLSNGVTTENINVVEISGASKLIPTEFMHLFDGFGGVYMTSAVWNANTRIWNYEVIIYTK